MNMPDRAEKTTTLSADNGFSPPPLPSTVPPPLPGAGPPPLPSAETNNPAVKQSKTTGPAANEKLSGAEAYYEKARELESQALAEKPAWENIQHFLDMYAKGLSFRLEGLKTDADPYEGLMAGGDSIFTAARIYLDACYGFFMWDGTADKKEAAVKAANRGRDLLLKAAEFYNQAIDLNQDDMRPRRGRARTSYHIVDVLKRTGADEGKLKAPYEVLLRGAVDEYNAIFGAVPDVSDEEKNERNALLGELAALEKKSEKPPEANKGFFSKLFGS
jgi:hypothetical protein